MRRLNRSPPEQFAFDLRREARALPIARDQTALLQALADLLLGALGIPVEDGASMADADGGANEPKDHA